MHPAHTGGQILTYKPGKTTTTTKKKTRIPLSSSGLKSNQKGGEGPQHHVSGSVVTPQRRCSCETVARRALIKAAEASCEDGEHSAERRTLRADVGARSE